MSCLLFLMRSLSALISSSMLSLIRFASASRCNLAMRSCSVSDAGGLRRTEKGSASLELWTDGGLEVEIMVVAVVAGYRWRGARGRGRWASRWREREEREGAKTDL